MSEESKGSGVASKGPTEDGLSQGTHSTGSSEASSEASSGAQGATRHENDDLPSSTRTTPDPGTSKDQRNGRRRARRTCEVEGCVRTAQWPTLLCISHGGGRRCQFPGCDKGARSRSQFCKGHGGGKRCEHPGCSKSARCPTSFCVRHGGGKRCQIEGCEKSAQGSEKFCKIHLPQGSSSATTASVSSSTKSDSSGSPGVTGSDSPGESLCSSDQSYKPPSLISLRAKKQLPPTSQPESTRPPMVNLPQSTWNTQYPQYMATAAQSAFPQPPPPTVQPQQPYPQYQPYPPYPVSQFQTYGHPYGCAFTPQPQTGPYPPQQFQPPFNQQLYPSQQPPFYPHQQPPPQGFRPSNSYHSLNAAQQPGIAGQQTFNVAQQQGQLQQPGIAGPQAFHPAQQPGHLQQSGPGQQQTFNAAHQPGLSGPPASKLPYDRQQGFNAFQQSPFLQHLPQSSVHPPQPHSGYNSPFPNHPPPQIQSETWSQAAPGDSSGSAQPARLPTNGSSTSGEYYQGGNAHFDLLAPQPHSIHSSTSIPSGLKSRSGA